MTRTYQINDYTMERIITAVFEHALMYRFDHEDDPVRIFELCQIVLDDHGFTLKGKGNDGQMGIAW